VKLVALPSWIKPLEWIFAGAAVVVGVRRGLASVYWAALLGAACGGQPSAQQAPTSPSPRPTPLPHAPAPPLTVASWRDAYDLDGDGTNDSIVSEYSGGAHCCYRIGAALSSTGTTTVLPFEMDGGYPGGLDLSQPAQFIVRTRAGSLPEIVYQIATYNGQPEPLDPVWTKRWKIRSHRVALCFAGGTPRVHDEVPDPPPCTR